jgi:integrase
VVARLNELRVHQESGRGPGDGNKTVGDVLNVWWERFENGKERVGSRASRDWRQLSPSARHRYRWARNLLTEEFESRRLRTLTRDDIEKGLAKIAADRDLAHDSVKRVRAVLVEALRFAQGERWIAVNEAERSRIGYIGRGDGEPTWLLPDEARRLDAACEDAWYGTMFRTMLATGVRPGEAAGPLESGVDLDAGRMHVRMGRSRDDRGVAVLSDHLKTEQSIRTIVLPARIVDVLRKQRRELAEARLRAGNWPGEPRFIFPDESGRIASDSEVAHQFKSLCAAAGLEAKTPMALRHTCIRTLKDAGVAYSEIARQMGHKDTRMVERVYGRDRSDVPVGTAGAAVMDRLFTASASA